MKNSLGKYRLALCLFAICNFSLKAADFIFEVPVKFKKLHSQVSHVSVTCHAQNKIHVPGEGGTILWGSKEIKLPVTRSNLNMNRSFIKTVRVPVDVPANQLENIHAYSCVSRVCKRQTCLELSKTVASDQFNKAKVESRLTTVQQGLIN